MNSVSALSLIGKQVLDSDNGVFIGYVVDVLIEESKKLSGFEMVDNDAKTIKFIPFSKVKNFSGDIVTVSSDSLVDNSTGVSTIKLLLVTEEGKVIGKILDFSINESGVLEDLFVDTEDSALELERFLIYPERYVQKIGKEVLFAEMVDITCLDSVENSIFNQNKNQHFDTSEQFDKIFRRISHSFEEVGQKFKSFDGDMLNQEFSKFTDSLNNEANRLFDNIRDKLANKKRVHFDTDLDAIYRELGGKTVRQPIYDKGNEAIIIPGQVITQERIEKIAFSNHLVELYRFAIDFDEFSE